MNQPEEPEETTEQGQAPHEPTTDWADEAAQARTLDDPRRIAPHDSAGVPSSEG